MSPDIARCLQGRGQHYSPLSTNVSQAHHEDKKEVDQLEEVKSGRKAGKCDGHMSFIQVLVLHWEV